MTNDDRRIATLRVDILRTPVDLDQQSTDALQLWLIRNDIDPTTVEWPLTIDFPDSTITLPANRGCRALNMPLKRVPLGPLWRTLADRGALWCANPAHRDHGGAGCPERVDVRGEHTTSKSLDPASHLPDSTANPDELLEQFVRDALERAAPGCDHPDPGQPIYDHTRPCAQCGATAVMDLFRTADAIEAFRARHTPPTVGYWEAGKGHRYPGYSTPCATGPSSGSPAHHPAHQQRTRSPMTNRPAPDQPRAAHRPHE